MEAVESDVLPALELLPSEVVCPQCNVAYHKYAPACPNMWADHVVRTPAQWAEEFNVTILDPDGWRGARGKDWSEPITRDEFRDRMMQSTVRTGGPWVLS